MMELVARSYGGKLFRPTPEIEINTDASFGVIATPWGNRTAAKKVVEVLTDYILSAKQDIEATSPFQKLTCLSALANNLRVGVMLANDAIYREDNKGEYVAGVEVLVFAHENNELAFAQVGSPQFFLSRQGFPWIPLSIQIDLSTELSTASQRLAPLPQNLLGLHTTTNMTISSVKTQPGDRLIFLSHSLVSHPMYMVPYADSTLETISRTLATDHPELPFWLGLLNLK